MAISQFCLSIPTGLLVFLASTVPLLCFYSGRSIYKNRQKVSKLNNSIGCVPAKVLQVGLEAQTWRDGWIVKAAWTDEKTKQSYIFSSQPQALRPQKHVGDSVLVLIDSIDPIHYTMEL
jgi:hypothetical protein